MSTRSQSHSVRMELPPEQAFDLLLRPSDICAWWGCQTAIVAPERGGLWSATWGTDVDDPDFITSATLVEFERPRRLVFGAYRYRAKSGGLPFDADFETEFLLEPESDGRATRLSVEQRGFPSGPEADAHFEGCQIGWQTSLAALQGHAAEHSAPASGTPRVGFVTLGVEDLPRATGFWRALLEREPESTDNLQRFELGGVTLAILPRVELDAVRGATGPRSAGTDESTPRQLISLHVGSRAAVDDLIGRVPVAGGRVTSAPAIRPWGAYAGFFCDPEGYAFELVDGA